MLPPPPLYSIRQTAPLPNHASSECVMLFPPLLFVSSFGAGVLHAGFGCRVAFELDLPSRFCTGDRKEKLAFPSCQKESKSH